MKHFYASQHMTNIDIVPAINTCMNNLKLLRANPSIALTFKTDAFGTILDDESVLNIYRSHPLAVWSMKHSMRYLHY